MSLTVSLAVNGGVIRRFHIRNRGPLPGDPCPEDPGGARRYTWDCDDGQAGELVHRRADGAVRLVADVFDRYLGGETG